MTIKHCKKCNRDLPVERFHVRRLVPSGRVPYCKDCSKAMGAEYRKRPEAKARSRAHTSRYVAMNPLKARSATKRWRESTRGRLVTQQLAAAFRVRNREKIKAQSALAKAVLYGRVVRPSACSRCGAAGKVEGHHYLGYAKEHRLDVQWVCRSCHYRLNREAA